VKTLQMSMTLNCDTANDRVEMLIDWWYNHLLFTALILLSYPFYHLF
jgi:hypothetical protein